MAGSLTFNPQTDSLVDADGNEFMLDSPYGDDLPQRGFMPGLDLFEPPEEEKIGVAEVTVNSESKRLQVRK